jgi:hypothetical protein
MCVQVVRAGAVQVMLSAVEAHKGDRDLGFTAYAVLSMVSSSDSVPGVKELCKQALHAVSIVVLL